MNTIQMGENSVLYMTYDFTLIYSSKFYIYIYVYKLIYTLYIYYIYNFENVQK